MTNAIARERARPIHPAFHSHSFRRSKAVREGLAADEPSPIKRAVMKMMNAGAMRLTTTRVAVEIFSFLTNGNARSGSARSNGLLFGVTTENAAPTAAIALSRVKNQD